MTKVHPFFFLKMYNGMQFNINYTQLCQHVLHNVLLLVLSQYFIFISFSVHVEFLLFLSRKASFSIYLFCVERSLTIQYSLISDIFIGLYCLSVLIVTSARFQSCFEFLEPILFPDQSLSHSQHS